MITFGPLDDAAAIAEIERRVADGQRAADPPRAARGARPRAGDAVAARPLGIGCRQGAPRVRRRARRLDGGAGAAPEIDALGRIGDGDPVQAATDELRMFAADEVAFAASRDTHQDALEELRRRLDRPVRSKLGRL